MRNKTGLKRLCIVFLILDLAAALLLILLLTGSFQSPGGHRDVLAEKLEGMSEAEREHVLALAAAEAASHVSMHSEVKSDGREIALYLSNAEENTCAVSVEIIIPGTGRLLAESGLVEPGWRLEKLPLKTGLDAGEYYCLVRLRFYTMDGNDLLGQTGRHMLLTVG